MITTLFHSDGLREVAGFIDIAAATYGDKICEELDGDGYEEGFDALMAIGDMDDFVGEIFGKLPTA
jgi:hypothetical protein